MKLMHSPVRLLLGGISIATAVSAVPLSSLVLAAPPPPQLSPEDAALIKLNVGRRAFNEKNYPVATNSFKEFLAAAPNNREAPSAWYGLGLCLLPSAAPIMLPSHRCVPEGRAARARFADRPMAQYHWGVSLRAIGARASAEAVAKRNDPAPLKLATHRKAALHQYGEAASQFAAAQAAIRPACDRTGSRRRQLAAAGRPGMVRPRPLRCGGNAAADRKIQGSPRHRHPVSS